MYKEIRKDGRYVTIDTRTGQEVKPFEGNFKPIGDGFKKAVTIAQIGLKPIGDGLKKTGTTAQVALSDINNLFTDVMPHLIYSDTAVDKFGRPLTKAQAGEHSYNRDARIKGILDNAPPEVRSVNRQTGTVPGSLPADYKRTELLASGQIPGSLPSDLKETEAQYYRNTSAPNGDENAKGTRTSPSPLKMSQIDTLFDNLELTRFTPNQNFDSNQLPTTSNSPYGSLSEDARVMGMSEEDSKLLESGQAVETVFDKGVESSGQIFKDPGSRAFLDYDGKGGSMGALRAAERARGMVTVNNQAYIPNPLAGQDDENDFLRINDSQKRDINAGRITAQDISNGHVNRINGADVGSVSQLVDFSNTYDTGFNIQPIMTSLDATEGNMYSQELPDMTKKMGFFMESPPIFQIQPEDMQNIHRNRQNIDVKY